MLVLLSLNLSFVFKLGYPTDSFWFNTIKFSVCLTFYKYKCTFELIDMRLGFIKYTCPDLANRGYYNEGLVGPEKISLVEETRPR